MTTTTDRPCLRTTVDQHKGDHAPTGLPICELTDIVTDLSDYVSRDDWDAMSDADREFAGRELESLHEARVAMASLPLDRRGAVEAEIEAAGCIDFTDIAPAIRRAIEGVSR